MSIASIAGLAVNVFGQKEIAVYEETSTRVKGRVQDPTVGADRFIFGVIQPLTDKTQEQRRTGSKTQGDLVLQTDHPIYYRDVTQADVRETVQTFVRHQGEVWRVIGPQNWTNHSGKQRYVIRKFVRSDV